MCLVGRDDAEPGVIPTRAELFSAFRVLVHWFFG